MLLDPSSFKAILLERQGTILRATLNRPEVLNAFNDDMEIEIVRLFTEAALDDATQVIILTGAGRAFSAGGDIEQMQQHIDHPERWNSGFPRSKALITAMLDCPKPVIARINGAAIGLGATVALFSDFMIAVEDAKIGDPHVKVGFVAGDGGAVIWPQLIGYARAKEYLMLGDTLTGRQAAEIGLITRAVKAEDLDRVVDDYANRLASGAARAIQWTKLSINIGLKQVAAAVLDASLAYESMSNLTRDHQEAVNAFREKRPPRFTGN
jgi:enoyl-CoA hydratase